MSSTKSESVSKLPSVELTPLSLSTRREELFNQVRGLRLELTDIEVKRRSLAQSEDAINRQILALQGAIAVLDEFLSPSEDTVPAMEV